MVLDYLINAYYGTLDTSKNEYRKITKSPLYNTFKPRWRSNESGYQFGTFFGSKIGLISGFTVKIATLNYVSRKNTRHKKL